MLSHTLGRKTEQAELDDINIVYQVIYNKEENKFNSIEVVNVYNELDYNGAHNISRSSLVKKLVGKKTY